MAGAGLASRRDDPDQGRGYRFQQGIPAHPDHNLNSRQSYIVTENGKKLNVVWINTNVGRVEENPTLSLANDKGLQ
jgi:hypothetical protein